MATMLGVDRRTLERLELGQACGPTAAEFEAFIARWERVPDVRERLEAEVRRTALRYRAAAVARNAARSAIPDGA